MRVLDASSIIYAWDNYPVQKFEKLWLWLADEVSNHQLSIPSVAFEEVEAKVPECSKWMRAQGILKLEITAAMLQSSMTIKALIGVVGENYHPKGVGENDLLIISAALAHDAVLVTDEARQPGTPVEPRKRKIPAVCALPQVGVDCINFREYFMSSPNKF